VNVRLAPAFWRGAMGVGTVHHVAWRAADDAAQIALRNRIHELGANPTPVIDRAYFHSVYFHEPGGVLFEIATDPPGFTVDEPVERLGERLMLPAHLESYRSQIERRLPPIHMPAPYAGGASRAVADARGSAAAAPSATRVASDASDTNTMGETR